MASKYKVSIYVEIKECPDEVEITNQPIKEGVGEFMWVVSSEEAYSIDKLEQIMLKTHYAALRDAFAHHLSSISKEYALSAAGSLDECEIKPYRVEGEIGRITFDTYWVKQSGKGSFSLFPTLHAKEWYRTSGFKELALVYGTVEESYRKASTLVNRVRHQEDATPSRTLRDNTEYEGEKVRQQMEQQATEILQQHGFRNDGRPSENTMNYSHQEVTLPEEKVEQAIQACAPAPELAVEMKSNPVSYEDPDQSVALSLDDVSVKKQKEIRKGGQKFIKKLKNVHNTIAHINHGGSYIINGSGFGSVLRLVLAFLLHNELLKYNLIFFVDGQRTLYEAIGKAFGWFKPLKIILDWYHLEKRCKEQLSLALKGKEIRNKVLEQLLSFLWHGCVDKAIASLQKVDPGDIKDCKSLEDLISYLKRNRPYIPCYSVRKSLGLCNSSNRGEKANDLIVSERQKHNGMSWSRFGSIALATITALVHNGEHKHWLQTQTLSFKFAC